MTFDEVIREFAELIGRVLAKRWLDSLGLDEPPEPETNRGRREPIEDERRPPFQGSAPESGKS
jgi:hypothetical protein